MAIAAFGEYVSVNGGMARSEPKPRHFFPFDDSWAVRSSRVLSSRIRSLLGLGALIGSISYPSPWRWRSQPCQIFWWLSGKYNIPDLLGLCHLFWRYFFPAYTRCGTKAVSFSLRYSYIKPYSWLSASGQTSYVELNVCCRSNCGASSHNDYPGFLALPVPLENTSQFHSKCSTILYVSHTETVFSLCVRFSTH